ncbi:hypothetical protein BCR44DRAFT_1458402 [Catenaria anguillulae PL171]|uniref:Nucleotide exchange factor SIL1 n=1 Tax=Catenaria anguillulae PL171 TaxID=765915 RepID=A0A1Y2HYJ1_9FUNG|nr:hypothetical protein BCR44DRAFT_1458402 [Catenaria anguillulae PL171]
MTIPTALSHSSPRRRWCFLAMSLALIATFLALVHGYRPADRDSDSHHRSRARNSPSADDDVICPMSAVYTSQPCYPRIFQSTSDEIYTKVLDGQVVPAGFDIRLDMQSGERWAKLPRKNHGSSNAARPADVAIVPGQDVHDDDLPPPLGRSKNSRVQQSDPSPIKFRHQDPHSEGGDIPYKRPSSAGGKRRVSAAETQSLQELMGDHGLDFMARFSGDKAFGEIADRHCQRPSRDAIMFYRVIGNSLQNNDKAIKHVADTIPDLTAHLIHCINWNTSRAGSHRAATGLAKSCLYALGSLVRGSKALGQEFMVEYQGGTLLRKWASKVPEVQLKCQALLEDLNV